ncbi:hypothetical protein AsAng_0007460 [Aureispira anguillae]|uniref:Uncharacterized protein n=1 Tax=Aureispira anguillae TaxID=2864201 RepID=A0A916DPB0_9BACT|nr:hypothetical protein AsAng_0007460 [Aureispira anguillae]
MTFGAGSPVGALHQAACALYYLVLIFLSKTQKQAVISNS